MPSAHDVSGYVFKNGSCILLARVVGADADEIVQADLSAAEYTVYLIDPTDEDADAAVAGHTEVALTVASIIFNTLQTDDLWDVDATGYNLKVTLDVSTYQAFAIAGREYRIVVTLTPTTGQPILVRFRVRAI